MALASAVSGGLIIGIFEGAGVVLTRVFSERPSTPGELRCFLTIQSLLADKHPTSRTRILERYGTSIYFHYRPHSLETQHTHLISDCICICKQPPTHDILLLFMNFPRVCGRSQLRRLSCALEAVELYIQCVRNIVWRSNSVVSSSLPKILHQR